MQTVTREITQRVDLCNAFGYLDQNAHGWSRRPLVACNLRGRFFRKKQWDYWCVMGGRFLFSANVSHVDCAAIGSVFFLQYDERLFTERTVVRPFARKPIMPQTVYGNIGFDAAGLSIDVSQTISGVAIAVEGSGFDGRNLNAEIEVSRPELLESINVVVPWNSRTFQFTSKELCLPAKGFVALGDEKFTFEEGAHACLDFGRGIWPFRKKWNRGVFSAPGSGGSVGVNMGGKWTDGTGMTENGIILDGKVYKIFDDIVFEHAPGDFMAPWQMKTAETDEIDVEFTPFYEHVSKSSFLFMHDKTHRVFGRYNGSIRAGDYTFDVEDVPGWAEEHTARW